jgi:hypothetical protein
MYLAALKNYWANPESIAKTCLFDSALGQTHEFSKTFFQNRRPFSLPDS